MTHFGILCPAAMGHLNPLLTLAQELQQRGHRVTCFQVLDVQQTIEVAGVEFCAIAPQDFPLGHTPQTYQQLGSLDGLAAVRYTLQVFEQVTKAMLREAPAAIRTAQVEALIVDQVTFEGGTIAAHLNLPFVTFCSALMVNRELSVPPFTFPWTYNPTWWGLLRNRMAYQVLDTLGKSMQKTLNQQRREWHLPPLLNFNETFSQLAQISQQPATFEFPRQELPPWFHFTGPHHTAHTRKPVSFPFEQLTGEPLIYASLGTLQNRQQWIFETIAQACQDLPVQLVLSLGQPHLDHLPTFPGHPIVVPYAPQLELLKRAALTITHAGLNTVLESLTNGVPMVAIPITNDQPGVAARLVWTGAGEQIPPNRLTVPKLREAIQRVLTQDSYRHHTRRLQTAIQQTRGAVDAAEVIEQAVTTRQPVLRA